ncbi:MAG TPA: helix-turn-helix transcriptional regulator [Candidatus Saccharimonadales bacterium]|nr:helix-turn-helix transcriptional regulator [Candidatus Saccharimonadales bacterium]
MKMINLERTLLLRQREVLDDLADGRTYQEIAKKLGVSIHTVRNHVRRIYQKLEVRNGAQAVAKNSHIPGLA